MRLPPGMKSESATAAMAIAVASAYLGADGLLQLHDMPTLEGTT